MLYLEMEPLRQQKSEQILKTHERVLARLVFWLLVISCCTIHSLCLNVDGHALLAFKNGIGNDPQQVLQNWNEGDENPCHWNGIFCTTVPASHESRVVGIRLSETQLNGSINEQIGQLIYLQRIDLSGNHFTGTIPNHIFDATDLRNIFLAGNDLSGPLPDLLGALGSLENLDLRDNKFEGNIPQSILNCHSLKTLVLQGNSFVGEIPIGMGSNLPNLQELDLSSNHLTGQIPSDLGDLYSLQRTLNLSENNLSGAIPASLGKLAVSMDLRNNNLSGPIPLNGSLFNQGPTAFVGNPGLCGFPLKVKCPEPNTSVIEPFLAAPNLAPSESITIVRVYNEKNGGLSVKEILAIAAGDAIGILLMGLVFVYCFRQKACKTRGHTSSSSSGKVDTGFCCKGLPNSSGWISEDSEQGELVHFDSQANFDLEDLLKASAYVLSKSGSGIVYKAILENGVTLAVRRLGEGGIRRQKEFDAEVQTIGHIRHPNIITLHAYYWGVDEKLLVYDYIPNGNLSTALHGNLTGLYGHVSSYIPEPLTWDKRLKIAKGVARGLAYLHECGPRKYIHGDIKASNILLDINMEPYISDFGLARLINISGGGVAVANTEVASRTNSSRRHSRGESIASDIERHFSADQFPYQPPEAGAGLKSTQKWDVYSFGVILLELLSGRSPCRHLLESKQDFVTWAQKLSDEKKSATELFDPTIVKENSSLQEMLDVLQIALTCVSKAPDQRPKMKQVNEALSKIEVPSRSL